MISQVEGTLIESPHAASTGTAMAAVTATPACAMNMPCTGMPHHSYTTEYFVNSGQRSPEHSGLTIGAVKPQTCGMDQVQEDQGIAKVIDRLADRFPALGRARVEQVVAETHKLLDGNPIRNYVPVLVERTAKDRLRRIQAGDPLLALALALAL